jgi:hypothetical protein
VALEFIANRVNEPVSTKEINSRPTSFTNVCQIFIQRMAVVPSRPSFLIPKIKQSEILLLNGRRRWGAESIPVSVRASYKQQLAVHSLSRILAFSKTKCVHSASS